MSSKYDLLSTGYSFSEEEEDITGRAREKSWSDSSDATKVLKERLKQSQDVACFIFEPLVQGAGGMLMQDPECLKDSFARGPFFYYFWEEAEHAIQKEW